MSETVEELKEQITSLIDQVNKIQLKRASPKTWYCQACNKTILKASKYAHLKGRSHLINVGREAEFECKTKKWYCEVCDKSICVTGKKYHLACAKHKKRLAELASA